jgi:DegV family protein with EDD domain
MRRRVAVVTDSSACLPPHLAATSGVAVVQLQLQVGDRFDEEAWVAPEDLIKAMQAGSAVSTSPPDPGAFFWTYQDAAAQGVDAVVSLHISEKMSQTCEVARQAAAQASVPVHVVDSSCISMSLGYAALAAAQAAAAGWDVRQVIAAAQRRYSTGTELIYVDTLEYLRKGGRIGAAQALLGTALSMKPLLTIKNGQVAPSGRALGADRAIRKLVEAAVKRAGNDQVDVAVQHYGPDARAGKLLDTLKARIPRARTFVLTQASSAVFAHLGPGAIGVTVSPV